MVKNQPANAGYEVEPWSGKIPHCEQLSPCTTATELASRAQEPQLLKSECPGPCSTAKEAISESHIASRKPTVGCSNEDPAQLKINKLKKNPSVQNKVQISIHKLQCAKE